MSKENIPSEEVDLGNLFKIIGKGFQNLFQAIGNFFKEIFHYFILLLLFLRSNALKLGIAALIGGAIGLYLDLTKPKVYSSTMIVEPNFKSTQQLYKNIDFYHELVKQKDSALLAEVLNITVVEARKIKGFYIEPIKNDNQKLELFNDYIEDLDTTTVKNIEVKSFKNNFTDFDYKYHVIEVKSWDNLIFEKLSNPIINSIESNNYFKNQKKVNDANLAQNENLLNKSLGEIDSLRNVYNEVLLAQAKKVEQGTSITLAENSKTTGEIELFYQRSKIGEDLIENNTERAKTMEVVNVVSSFSRIGSKEKGFYKKDTFKLAMLLFCLMLFFILGRQLNGYLKMYKNVTN